MYKRMMQPELKTVRLKVGFEIEVSGYYTEGEPDTDDTPGTGDQFEFSHMEIIEGNVLDVFFWATDTNPEDIETICIEAIKKDDY
jgi:hypothetical protein